MLRNIVKPVGGLMLGWAMLAGDDASAQTTGYVTTPVPATTASSSRSVPTATIGQPSAATVASAPVASAPVSSAPAPAVTLGYVEPQAPSRAFASCGSDCAPGVWVNIDYLIWWMKAAPAPGPLATTGSLLDPRPGALGQPGTRSVFGTSDIGNNPFNGLRLQAGTWIDEARSIGYEGSLFTLEHRRNFEGISSNSLGSPLLARPGFNIQSGQEEALPISIPNSLAGALTAASSTRFSGWDANVAFNGTDSANFRADGLVGFRALYLAESLTIADSVTALADQGANPAALRKGESRSTLDRFGTNSNFWGGQIGGRLTWVSDRWITTAVVKLALGVTDEIAQVQGLTSAKNNNGGGAIPAGILANYGSSGSYFTNQFAVVPEFNLNLSYRVTQNVSLRAGYTFLYWSDVVRPGNVNAHAVNPALVPSLPTFGAGPLTPTRAVVDSTDFWTQGLNLGVEFRF